MKPTPQMSSPSSAPVLMSKHRPCNAPWNSCPPPTHDTRHGRQEDGEKGNREGGERGRRGARKHKADGEMETHTHTRLKDCEPGKRASAKTKTNQHTKRTNR